MTYTRSDAHLSSCGHSFVRCGGERWKAWARCFGRMGRISGMEFHTKKQAGRSAQKSREWVVPLALRVGRRLLAWVATRRPSAWTPLVIIS